MKRDRPLPVTERKVLNALQSQADRLSWHERKDGWAKVVLDDARADANAAIYEPATFESALNVLDDYGLL